MNVVYSKSKKVKKNKIHPSLADSFDSSEMQLDKPNFIFGISGLYFLISYLTPSSSLLQSVTNFLRILS